MRRLVFCFDGSWNKLTARAKPTNVVLVAESISPTDRKGVHQIVHYDEGVGTSSDETFRGGAFGKGLELNIREAYRFLIFNYRPDDEIFVFGFSRGAFTAMSFVGFLRCAGILCVADARQIDDAWSLYQANAHRIDDDAEDLRRFRAKYCGNLCVDKADLDYRRRNPEDRPFDPDKATLLKIKYVGLWDMVGSLGWRVVRATFDRRAPTTFRQHDTSLSAQVDAARHAVALDEHRVHFMPTLWENTDRLNAEANVSAYDEDAPYQQRWFPGDHTSVGGGGSERKLANAALHWVIDGAVDKGLEINLSGRSQLRDIRYDARGTLRGTPLAGFGDHAMAWVKGKLLSTDRSGPGEVQDIHPAALRRWFAHADTLPEGVAYRPRTLAKLGAKIEGLRDRFVPVETKDVTASARYIVQSDDTLSKIARDELGDINRYMEIFDRNRDLLDSPNHIFPDDALRMPTDWVPRNVSPD